MGEAEKEAMKTRQLQLEKENRDLAEEILDLEEQIKHKQQIAKEETDRFKVELASEKEQFKIRIFKLQESL